MENFDLYAGAGAALSLLFSYFPKLGAWHKALPSDKKRLVMLGAISVLVVSAYLLTCNDIYTVPGITCGEGSAAGLIKAAVAAVMGNQTAHRMTPKG